MEIFKPRYRAGGALISAIILVSLSACVPVDSAGSSTNAGSAETSNSVSFAGLTKAYNLDGNRIRLEWDAASGDVSGYIVYEVALDQSLSVIDQVEASQHYYIVAGLAPLSKKSYVVRAQDFKGNLDDNFIKKSSRTFGGASSALFTAPKTVTLSGLNTLASVANSVKVYAQYEGDAIQTLVNEYSLPSGNLDVTLDSTKQLNNLVVHLTDIATFQEDSNTVKIYPGVASAFNTALSVNTGFKSVSIVNSKLRTTFSGTCSLEGATVANSFLSVTASGGTVVAADCTSGILSGQIDYSIPTVGTQNAITITEKYGSNALSQISKSTTILTCPKNYIAVPSDSDLGTGAFCVAKFEMKAVTSNPVGVSNPALNLARANGNQTLSLSSANIYYPASIPEGTPYVNVQQRQAIVQCDKLNDANGLAGRGHAGTFQLITNAQWQALARNVEYTSSNWSTNIVGYGSIPRGHTYNALDETLRAASGADTATNKIAFTGHVALAVASTDGTTVHFGDTGKDYYANPADEITAGYIGTGYDSASSWEQRRTLSLSNGEVVWDLAGNVREWVNLQDGSTSDFDTAFGTIDGMPNQASTYNSHYVPLQPVVSTGVWEFDNTGWQTWPATSTSVLLNWFMPKGYFTSLYSTNYSTYNFGMMTLVSNSSSRAIQRGGAAAEGSIAGIFAANLGSPPSYNSVTISFRCVSNP